MCVWYYFPISSRSTSSAEAAMRGHSYFFGPWHWKPEAQICLILACFLNSIGIRSSFFYASFQWLSVTNALKRMPFTVLYSVTQTRATFQSTVPNLPTVQPENPVTVLKLSAVGFAKLVAGLVTAYVRASEYWLKKKRNKCCFFILSIIAFAVVTGVALAYAHISIDAMISNTPEAKGELVARYTCIFLPFLAFFPFCIIAWTLDTHCQQDQYSTLSDDQIPSTVISSTPMDDVSSDSDNRNYHKFW